MSVRQKKKRDKAVKVGGDKGSIWLLMIFIAFGYFFSFRFGMTNVGRIYHWNLFYGIGVFMIVMGMIIRIFAINTLKQHFTYTVTQIENHELVESGLYKWIRHPGYLGQMIIFTGTAVSFSNWISVLSMFVAISFGYLYRIGTEEKFLIAQMGQKYLDYQKRTKRLIPLVY
jgi:protein-S-isoprenylcysteine O-methyltransferase Ste14